MTELSRRQLIVAAAAAAGAGAAYGTSQDDGGGAPLPIVGGGHQVTVQTDAYQVDIATDLASIPTPDIKPQFIFCTGSADQGEYVNVNDANVPLYVDDTTFRLHVVDALGDVPKREYDLEIVFVRSGADKGVHVNYASSPTSQRGADLTTATGTSLSEIPEADLFPGLYWATGSADQGGYVQT